MKRKPSLDLKQIPIADGLLHPYSYKLIEEELQRLRSNEYDGLEFFQWELNAFKGETDKQREKRHKEEDSSRQNKIVLRGLFMATFLMVLIAKIIHISMKRINLSN